MTATTTTPLIVETAALESVTFDLYRNIHKGIRAGLFSVTQAAGQVDPHDADAVRDVAERWARMVELLVGHAEHEDEFVQPTIERLAPAYASEIAEAHPRLEAQMAELEVLADRAVDACPEQARLLTHRLYLGVASFTAEYLQHQEFEEFEVMVMLSQHLSFEELLAIDMAIVSSIPPEQMAKTAAYMLPAMNIEDQTELFLGARAGVPPEVFQGMVALAQSVLEPARYELLARRLGV
ncbi:MAG TPA: hemerythrin domain-containing protein [Acidimicrobiia bacterium]|nr:hemerythrin domain-containing protein [Acidimicrobiia bacterium]